MTRYLRLFVYGVFGLVGLVLVFAAGHYLWPNPPNVQFVTRYRALWHTVTQSDTVFRTQLRVDTLRLERIVTFRDTVRVLIAQADSLPPDSALPVLRRACSLLDSALTTCGERVHFWHLRADTVTAQRDSALALANDAITHLRSRRCSLGLFAGYGFKGPDAGLGVVCRIF